MITISSEPTDYVCRLHTNLSLPQHSTLLRAKICVCIVLSENESSSTQKTYSAALKRLGEVSESSVLAAAVRHCSTL